MRLTIIITGICAILKRSDRIRVLLLRETSATNCENTVGIPPHRAYLRWLKSDNTTAVVGDVGKEVKLLTAEDGQFLKNVLILIGGTPVAKTIKYPSGKEIPDVASMGKIYPGFVVRSEYQGPHVSLPPSVAACLDLEFGKFAKPNVDDGRLWHFFPPRGHLVRGPLAHAVHLQLEVKEPEASVFLLPFASGSPTELLRLKNKANDVTILLGNTPLADVAPVNPNAAPPTGPDYHFEIYYQMIDRSSDPECPPIPFFEGDPFASVVASHCGGLPYSETVAEFAFAAAADGDIQSISLGGGNCPPTQWP